MSLGPQTLHVSGSLARVVTAFELGVLGSKTVNPAVCKLHIVIGDKKFTALPSDSSDTHRGRLDNSAAGLRVFGVEGPLLDRRLALWFPGPVARVCLPEPARARKQPTCQELNATWLRSPANALSIGTPFLDMDSIFPERCCWIELVFGTYRNTEVIQVRRELNANAISSWRHFRIELTTFQFRPPTNVGYRAIEIQATTNGIWSGTGGKHRAFAGSKHRAYARSGWHFYAGQVTWGELQRFSLGSKHRALAGSKNCNPLLCTVGVRIQT